MEKRVKKIKQIKNSEKIIYDTVFRYALILLLGLGNLFLFYKIFTPLTVYPVFFILKLFYPTAFLSGITIRIDYLSILLIKSCIAGAAYYLLLALVFSTPMQMIKRVYLALFVFLTFLFINITRIVILVFLLINESSYFDITHKFIWYGLSTIFVVGIWFFSVWIFKIKDIPVYSDMKNLLEIIKQRK